MNKLTLYFLLFAMTIASVACDDHNVPKESNTHLVPEFSIAMPDAWTSLEPQVHNEKVEAKNITTGRVLQFASLQDVKLLVGLYDFTYSADVKIKGDTTMHHVVAFKPAVELTTSNTKVELQAFENIENDDFIIQEVFFTGTLRPSGRQYHGDDYVMIYNNTDHVLYADGLTLLESYFTTVQKFNYRPNIIDTAMTVAAIYTIPGSGRDHPVKQGESLRLVDTGIDHRVANPNSFDLSDADFEWFDESQVPAHLDIDGPTVPNLDRWHCYTKSFFVLHNRGFKAWALARIPIPKEQYLSNYRYTFNYEIVVPAGTYPMEQTKYYVPNKWIVDAVNGSVEARYVWSVTAPSLDRGWTYCGKIDGDKTRYFHSVRRKMLYLKDGRPVLQDTNNSCADFNPYCIASEIEKQGTALDKSGTKCTTLTWDGVIPKK